ncbi:hypothetical protein KEM60_02823 [Austwickia sp. TVS 96-490-7B]|uniref:M16 family metallopeptidase n=1 Tax=Austwickia sp. TVS 96-490-7B TaxID=2830843 RepID=UPI001C5772B4|nr:pitrilysin family protein [Austwickia sp. TVS 96-490-7B]MBW3086595.1 hypothetical protein [Austwickia sp. TVS 96-490-7B]
MTGKKNDVKAPAAPRPVVGQAPPWAFPVPHIQELSCGARLVTYSVPGQHVLSLRVAVEAPLAAEPRGREGVGTLMARTLDEGSRRYDAEQTAEMLERRGVALGAGVGERGLVLDLDVARGNLAGALELLTEVLIHPVFPEQQVRRHIRSRLADIEQDRAHPGQRAAIAFADAYYHRSDRLSLPTGGTAESVHQLTREDIAAYHQAVVCPGNATVVVAGDLTGVDVAGLIDDALSGWSTPSRVAAAPSTPTRLGGSRVVLVDRPGSVQSELYVGCAGPDRTVAGGWAPYPVLGHLIGGGPQARIDAVLREDKGYTYGIRCGFRPRRGEGLFIASGSVRTEVTAESVDLLLGILEEAREGFTTAEVVSGVDYLCHTAPGRFATADAVADEASARALEGLTTEHTTQVLRDTRELTPERLRHAYQTYVDGTWTSVIVGDAEALAGPLAALGRGSVTVIDS